MIIFQSIRIYINEREKKDKENNKDKGFKEWGIDFPQLKEKMLNTKLGVEKKVFFYAEVEFISRLLGGDII